LPKGLEETLAIIMGICFALIVYNGGSMVQPGAGGRFGLLMY